MSPYLRRLEDLISLNRAGAVEPGAAVETMWTMQDDRRENRLARRQAQQEAMMAAQNLAYKTAQEGGSLEDLITNPSFSPTPQALSYFGQGGISALSPTLDEEDAGAIADSVVTEGGDPNQLRAAWSQRLQQAYGPEAIALMPEVDKILSEAFKRRMTMTQSGGQLERLLAQQAGR